MTSLPWHPKLVHLPLALAFLVPALGVLLWIATARGWLPRRAWLLFVLAQLGLALGAWAASATGEEDEHLVERFVPEAALETHEEAAEAFLWGGALALGVGLLPLVAPRRRVGPAAGAAIAAAAVVAGLAVRAGEAGGALVYRYGAAAGHGAAGQGAAVGGQVDPRRSGREFEDD
jgi:uncharacterized membrane protein